MMGILQFVVDPIETSERLDLYTSTHQPITRSRLKTGLNSILINGKQAKLSSKLKGGEKVVIEWTDPVPEDILPEDIPLDIIFEDKDILVVNKPQGMVTHPANGNWTGTLVNALLFYNAKNNSGDCCTSVASECRDSSDCCTASMHSVASECRNAIAQNNLRPGIVHRLDKDTSGIIITAKNHESEEYLQAKFASRKVYKEYIAIVKGAPPCKKGTIKTQIVRDPKDRKKFFATTGTDLGKFAHTEYECLGVYKKVVKNQICTEKYSLLRLKLKTGRTHQIRVHLKYLGCPILGDPLYSKPDDNFKDATLMLHSRVLGIRIPSGEKKFFVAKTPARFKKVLKVLHENYSLF